MTNDNAPLPTLYEGGRVVRLVTDDELIFNLGAIHGVQKGMVFDILDATTQKIRDPRTQEDLGSIDRTKSQVRVIQVSDRISLGRVYPARGRAGISSTADALMGPKPLSPRLTGSTWPDGVSVNDPVRYTNTTTKI